MSAGNVSQTFALQHEKVRPQLSLLYQLDATLWNEIKSRTDIEVVSSRPTRVPLEIISGGIFRSGDPDGGDLGLGSSPTTDFMTLVPTYFFQCSQWTKQAEISTNSDEKAIEEYSKLIMKRAMETFNTYMEAVFTQGDGSNTLDTVVTVNTNSLVVNNANQFQGNQPVDVWSALSGTFRGTAQIQTVDAANKTIWLTTAPPAGTTAGDLLLVNGSAGVANSGLYGLLTYQLNSNAGTVAGLSRSAYPGMLSTPYVNGNNQALTPSNARKLFAQIQIAIGAKKPTELDLQFNMGPDMMAAWENVGLIVSSVIQNQLTGSNQLDMLKKSTPKTFAGRPIINDGDGNIHSKPGRIDGICLKEWFRCENQPIDYWEIGGQTMFPTYGASGGLSASTFFYLWTGVQIGQENVRAGTYSDNIAIPSGY